MCFRFLMLSLSNYFLTYHIFLQNFFDSGGYDGGMVGGGGGG